MVMRNRVNAGTVAVTRLAQRVQRPHVLLADREARRTIAKNLLARYLLEQRLAARDVVAKFFTALVGRPQVAVAMAGELVAAVDDGAHHLRVALGDPAQGKEGCLDVAFREQAEDALDIAFDAAIHAVPAFTRYVRRKSRDLEIVLDVDRHGITDLAGLGRQCCA